MSAHAIPPLFDWLYSAMPEGKLREAVPGDEVDGIRPSLVAEPAGEREMAEVLSRANSSGVRVSPRGHGSKSAWGATPDSLDLVVSTATFDRVLEHAHQDLTVTVESGVTIANLQNVLSKEGQRLALDPLWPEQATVGGVIATNDTGTLRLRFGGVRDLIIGVTVVLSDGTIASSGGKVVKNVAGYDLPKLMTGAFGTLGVITRAVFRLHPLPEDRETVTAAFPDAQTGSAFMLAVAGSALVPTGLQMRAGAGKQIEVDVRLEGVRASIDAQRRELDLLQQASRVQAQEADVWRAREELFGGALVCKVSMLPTQIGSIAELLTRRRESWEAVVQSTGLGLLRLDTDDPVVAAELISALRSQLKTHGGAIVLLQCPAEWKERIGVWGAPGSAQPLMERVKAAFDPKGILNRGRFVGGL